MARQKDTRGLGSLDASVPYDTMGNRGPARAPQLAAGYGETMTIAWTRTIALGLLLWPLGCIITVDDDPNDDPGGFAGDGGSSGSGGSAGYTSGSGGDTEDGGSSGSGGSAPIDATCEPEVGDDADECVQCLKRSCCDAWLECNDETCVDELTSVRECVASEEFPDAETLGECISVSSYAMDGFVQPNTQELITCSTTPAGDAGLETLCSSECFGSDIYLE